MKQLIYWLTCLWRGKRRRVQLLSGGWCDGSEAFFVKLGLYEATNLTEWRKVSLKRIEGADVRLPVRFECEATGEYMTMGNFEGRKVFLRTYKFEIKATAWARRQIFDATVDGVKNAVTTESSVLEPR